MNIECHGPCSKNDGECPTPYLCEVPNKAEERKDKLITRGIAVLICVWVLALISLFASISFKS